MSQPTNSHDMIICQNCGTSVRQKDGAFFWIASEGDNMFLCWDCDPNGKEPDEPDPDQPDPSYIKLGKGVPL